MIVYAGVGGKAEASDLGHWFELVLTLLSIVQRWMQSARAVQRMRMVQRRVLNFKFGFNFNFKFLNFNFNRLACSR